MTKQAQPKPDPNTLVPDDEALGILQQIEGQYPPRRCSLETYRDILIALRAELHARISELNDEIGGS